jgi:hypothetical protein
MPLAGTPFADLPYSKQLEIVSYALEQATPRTIGKRKIEEVTVESDEDKDGDGDGDGDGLEVEFGDGDDIMEAFDEGKAAMQLIRTTAMVSDFLMAKYLP